MRLLLHCLLPLLFLSPPGNAQMPDDGPRLSAGHALSLLLAPEDAGQLNLEIAGSESASILLDAAVPEISYRVISSQGVELVSGHLPTLGWAVIPFAAPAHGQARLQLSTENPTEGLPGVRVRVELRSIPRSALAAQTRAARFFASAQLLHRSLHAVEVRRAIGNFQQAAYLWDNCGDHYGEVLALGGKAEAEIELSRYNDARQTLQRALRLDPNEDYLRGGLFHLGARIHLDLWEWEEAVGYAQEELRLGRQIGDAASIALAEADLAGASWPHTLNSNEFAERAHTDAMAAGVPEVLGLERRWKGWIEDGDEHHLRAIEMFNESEANFRQAGDMRAATEDQLELAASVTIKGDRYLALKMLENLEPVLRQKGNSMEYGLLMKDIGDALLNLGKPKLAEIDYHRARVAYESAGYRFGIMSNLQSQCQAALLVGEHGDAMATCKEAFDIATSVANSSYLGAAYYGLGLAEREAGHDDQARIDISKSVEKSQAQDDTRMESKEHIQLGELLAKSGKRQGALVEFLLARRLSENVADPASLLESQYAVAQWYLADGQLDRVETELKPALEKVEAARSSVASSSLQASYFAVERKCYELAVELQMRGFARDAAGGGDARALEQSEQSHARGLLDALSARSAEENHRQSDLQSARMQSDIKLSRAFDRRLKLLVEGGARRDFDASSAELTQALGDVERTEDQAHESSIQMPLPAPTLSASEIEQASRRSGTAYFEFELGPERSYLWVVRAGELKSYVLPARARLERMARQWRAQVAGTERSETGASARLRLVSARLSCMLFADAVKPDMPRIVVVPDGSLAMMPFAALPENGCSPEPGEPLVVAHEVMEAPSLSVFLSRKRPKAEEPFRGELAIVADPVFDVSDSRLAARRRPVSSAGREEAETGKSAASLPRLINTGYEAEAIEKTVQGAAGKDKVLVARGLDANLETVLSPAMRDYRIWHLATHGIYDQSMPEFSGLVLSQIGRDGSPRSGFLKANDIAGLNVRAELVVLNACDSGAGRTLSGEGVMGLSYAFLRSGARQVISTLWSIDDAKSKDLMVEFYKELMQNGGDAAAALRQAQLKLMRRTNSSAPYYWAGYALTSVGR
jgi:CHAT domain-containing protein/tetratricopeptide (TPR) repeat protein